MKKLYFLTKYYKDGPSSRYRSHNYQKYFENYEIEYQPLMYENYVQELYSKTMRREKYLIKIKVLVCIIKRFLKLLFLREKNSFFIIEKELFPGCPYFIEKFLLKNKNYSLDYDDYVGANYYKNKLKKIFFKDKIKKLVKNAEIVTVGNKWYFEEFKTNNLIYLPTVIDLDKYKNIKEKYESEKISIIWIGSMSSLKYLKLVENSLIKLSKKYSIKLKVIGGKIELNELEIEYIKWTDETEVQEILSGDIGIMPLSDTLWEKGKCGFKLIQYMACGLPVVASPAPANEEIIIEGENGYIAKTQEEWYQYLEELISDTDLRRKMGISGRKRIEENYTYQVWGSKYIEFLESYLKN